jgi:outer membrane protein assembly factor BamB
VDLEARAVFNRFKVSTAKIVGIAALEDGLVGSDADGRLFRAAADGKILWTVETANAGNVNSVPVVLNGRVYFSGLKELVVIDPGSGAVLGRQKLDAASADAFGRRPAAVPGGVLFPANKALLVKHPDTGATLAAFPVGGGGSMMSPLVHGGRIYIADTMGVIRVLDAGTGRETAVLATSAVNPVAGAILISGGRGFLAGRRGDIAAFDPEKNALLWQTRLEKDSSAAVYHDLLPADGVVYAFSKDRVYVLDAAAGTLSAETVRDAAAPPVEAGGSVYVPLSDGRVARLAKGSGRIGAAADIGGKPSTRPAVLRDMIALGTGGGEIVVVNPRALR